MNAANRPDLVDVQALQVGEAQEIAGGAVEGADGGLEGGLELLAIGLLEEVELEVARRCALEGAFEFLAGYGVLVVGLLGAGAVDEEASR